MTTLHLRNSIGRSPLRLGFLLIPLVLACFGLSPIAQAANETTSSANTGEGNGALQSVTTGSNNTALGAGALFSLTTGVQNTAVGAQALKANTADAITAVGFQALVRNTTGSGNVATGWRALFQNTTGIQNTAVGQGALASNTVNINNTATGFLALNRNGSSSFFLASGNTANGFQALENNTTGDSNTGIGADALFANTTGGELTAIGFDALSSNTIGQQNTAVGDSALNVNTKGNFNTAVGNGALALNTTGSDNIALGSEAGVNITTGGSNIDIGSPGVSGETNTIHIGEQGLQIATFIAGISGVDEGGTMIAQVTINSNGQLGTQLPMVSSQRFKKDIKPMDKASEAILALKPVTFRYKEERDPKGIPQFGLVAEEVEKVNPDLITRDHDGKPYTVRYDAVNAMLLNEFLKEHRQVQEQQKEIEALRTLIQKVSDKVEMNKPAPQMAENNQ